MSTLRAVRRVLRTNPSTLTTGTSTTRTRPSIRAMSGSRRGFSTRSKPNSIVASPDAHSLPWCMPVINITGEVHHRITVRRQPAPANTGDRTYLRTPVLAVAERRLIPSDRRERCPETGSAPAYAGALLDWTVPRPVRQGEVVG